MQFPFALFHCEKVCNIVGSGYVLKINLSEFDLIFDKIVSYINMFSLSVVFII